MNRKSFRTLLLAALLLTFSFTSTASAQDKAAATQELRVIDLASWHTAFNLNPFAFGYSGSSDLIWLRMVGIDPKFQPINIGLADSWTFNADRTSVTLKLKQGYKFSDGSPITAKEAAWSLNYLLMTNHKDLATKFAGQTAKRYWSSLKGAQDVFDGKIPLDEFGAANAEGIKIVDDYTLTLTFTQPTMVLSLEPLQLWFIVKPESVMAGKGKNYGADAYWTTEKGTAYPGPWMLESYTANSGMTLVPNPNWNGKKPTLTRIKSTFIADTSTAITAFENKEADVMLLPLSPSDAESAKTSDYLSKALLPVTDYNVEQLLVTAFPPMEDVHVRRAIMMAIDRQTLADVLGGGAGQKVFKPLYYHHSPDAVPTCSTQFASIKPLAFDPAQAKAELAKSPYASTIQNMEINITLGMFGEPVARNLVQAQVIQNMLEANLGLKNIKIHQEPMADFNKPTYATHLWPNAQGESTVDVYSFMMNLVPLSGPPPADASKISMLTLPNVPDLVALMKQAGQQTDPVKLCEVLAKAQQVWVDQVYTVSLFTNDGFRLVAPWVKNLTVFGGNSNYLNNSPGMEQTYVIEH